MGLAPATSAHAQFPVRIASPVAPIGPILPAKPGLVAPIHASASIVPDAAKSAVVVPAVLEQLLNEQITPAQAWQTGALTADDLMYLFTHYLDRWGTFGGKANDELRRALVGLLVKYDSGHLQQPEKLPPAVQLWLVDYYQSIKDPQTVSLAENVLSSHQALTKDAYGPTRADNPLPFLTVGRLAWYYEGTNQWAKAAQSWLRLQKIYGKTSEWGSDALYQAMCDYIAVGDDSSQAKAEALFQRLMDHINVYTAPAIASWAEMLLRRGDTAAVRHLIEQLPERKDQTSAPNQAIAWALGRSYYMDGDFARASKQFQLIVAQPDHPGSGDTPSQRDVVMQGVLTDAQSALQHIDAWRTSPIVCAPNRVDIVLGPDEDVSTTFNATKTIQLTAFAPTPFTTTCDDPNVIVQSTGTWQRRDDRLAVESTIHVSIRPEALNRPLETTLTIQSREKPVWKIAVPVSLIVRAFLPGEDAIE